MHVALPILLVVCCAFLTEAQTPKIENNPSFLGIAYNVSGLCVVALSRNLILTTTLDRAITQNPCYVPFLLQIMTVDRQHTEILDRPDQMWAEGTAVEFGESEKFKPKANEIETLLKAENWLIYDLDIWFDNLQGFWRWSCKIVRP